MTNNYNFYSAPHRFDDFIGQDQIVARLKAEIESAKQVGARRISDILLIGGTGIGKTALANIIANEIGGEVVFVDASSFSAGKLGERNILSFLQKISDCQSGAVIIADDFDNFSEFSRSLFANLIQRKELIFKATDGKLHSFKPCSFTFIGTTRDPSKISSSFAQACLCLTFGDYTHDELMLIFKKNFASKKLEISDALIEKCISSCRCSIREVESIVIGLLTEAAFLDTNTITEDILNNYLAQRRIDADDEGGEAQ